MFGNILNNTQICACIDAQAITIEPFDKKKLKLAHYALSAGSVLWMTNKNQSQAKGNPGSTWKHDVRADFRNNDEYVFEPNEYAVVEISEFIRLGDGIMGHFIPSSSLIELGFGLTAGKIEPGYGNLGGKTQQIRFGLKNLRQDQNVLLPFQCVAHIYFIDLRGLNNNDVDLSKNELKFLMERYPRLMRARDDGVDYGSGE